MRLTDRIYLVASGRAGSNFTNAYDCDVYLVDCGDGMILIDAGAGLDTEMILAAIRKDGFSPEHIRYLLLTHGHADHAGGAFALRAATGATVLAHPDCAAYVSEGDLRAIALEDAVKAGVYPADYRFSPCPVKPMQDSQTLSCGAVTITAFETPGHCSGHHVYRMESPTEAALFAGDCIFLGGKISLQPIWDCDLMAYAASARKLAAMRFDALLPSHFGIDLREGARHAKAAAAIFDRLDVPGQASGGRSFGI